MAAGNFKNSSAAMLLLKLLETRDMYGYEMIEELSRRSERLFELKSGALYPLLHQMEEQKLISSYLVEDDTPRPRRYYKITPMGRSRLAEKQAEWLRFSEAVNGILRGGKALEKPCAF